MRVGFLRGAASGAALAALLVAACNGERRMPGNPPSPVRDMPAAAPVASPIYEGRWAVQRALCGTGAWRLTGHDLTAPDGQVCRFEQAQGSQPTQIAASCRAGRASARWRLRIAHRQSADVLLVEDSPLGNVALIRCPRRRTRAVHG